MLRPPAGTEPPDIVPGPVWTQAARQVCTRQSTTGSTGFVFAGIPGTNGHLIPVVSRKSGSAWMPAESAGLKRRAFVERAPDP